MRWNVFRKAALWGLWAAGLIPAVAEAGVTAEREVLVIEIRGPIDESLTYIVRRGLEQAGKRSSAAVVFAMDTPGGGLQACQDIVALILKAPAPTYTLVDRSAYSAGALIALATRKIYMTPGSVIGDAMPILSPPLAGPQAVPDDLREKMDSATAGFARATAEQGGHDPEVAESFVRRAVELKKGDTLIKPSGRLLTLTNREAEKSYGDPPKSLLSAGTVRDLDELLAREGLAGATIRPLKVTALERLARWIKWLAPLFLIGGVLGIWIEIKTPGFGLPGALGIASLAVFFVGHHVAGLAGWEDMAVFIVGLILLLIELLVIPGFGFTGGIGILLMAAGILMAMIGRAPGGGWMPSLPEFQIPFLKLAGAVLGAGIAMLLLARYLPRTTIFRNLILESSTATAQGFTAALPDESAMAGATGRALNDLRPSGIAMVNGRRVDVVTGGEYLPKDSPVRVLEVVGNRIVVARDENTPEFPGGTTKGA